MVKLALIVGLLISSLLLSLVVEITGLLAGWWGADHASQMLAAELGYLSQDFTRAVAPITGAAAQAYYWLFEWTWLEAGLVALCEWFGLADILASVLATVQVFLVRLMLLGFSLPLFVLFAVVGFTSGLTLRDLRKFGAGREYGQIYHHAKASFPAVLSLALLAYLSLPVSLHPNLIMVPCAILVAGHIGLITGTFKKHL
jgi:hypothetical protein